MKLLVLIAFFNVHLACLAQTGNISDSVKHSKLLDYVFVNNSSKPFLKGDTIRVLSYNDKSKTYCYFKLPIDISSDDSFKYFLLQDSLVLNPKNSTSKFEYYIVEKYYTLNHSHSFWMYNGIVCRHSFSNGAIYIDGVREINSHENCFMMCYPKKYEVRVDQSILGLEIQIKRPDSNELYNCPFTIDTYLGRLVYEGDIVFEKGNKDATIRIENMPKGSYSITIGQGSKSYSAFFQVK